MRSSTVTPSEYAVREANTETTKEQEKRIPSPNFAGEMPFFGKAFLSHFLSNTMLQISFAG
jgi:hypothetical protein